MNDALNVKRKNKLQLSTRCHGADYLKYVKEGHFKMI